MSPATTLEGLRVLEIGRGFASRFAGFLLASAGAKVTSCWVGPPLASKGDPNTAVYRGTLAAWLDSAKSDARAVSRLELIALASEHDVVVDDLDTPVRRKLGLNPIPLQLPATWVLITPFGAEYWERPGSDLVVTGLAAAAWPIGCPDRVPLTVPHHQASVQAGAIAATLAAAAAFEGCPARLLDVSMAEVIAAYTAINGSLFVWEREGHRAARSGGAYPYTILPCADAYVCLAARTNTEWRRMLAALGNPTWASDPRFQDVRKIAESYAEEADVRMRETLAQFSSKELLARAAEAGCAIAPLRTFEQLAADDDLRRREVIADADVEGHIVAVPRLPWLRGVASGRRWGLGSHITQERWRPLAGKRVVDFGWVISAPLVGMIAAELGADVIKIESAERTDNLRLRDAMAPGGIDWRKANNAPTWHSINRGKRSLGVNVKTTAGRDIVLAVIAHVDALIENYSVGTLERMGLDDATLRAANPNLLRISLTAAGRDGRLAGLKGYAATTGALAGLEGSVGYPSEPGPTGMLTFGLADYAAGTVAAFVLVAALNRDGGYLSLDASQMEANVIGLGEGFAALAAGWPTRPGNRSYLDAPAGIYRAADGGYVTLEVIGDEEWDRLSAVIGALADRFPSPAARLAAADDLDELVESWVTRHPRESVVQQLQAAGLRAGPVLSLAERKEHEIFRSRGFDVQLTLGNGAVISAPSAPWLAGAREAILPRGPALGEHGNEICSNLLGMTQEQIAELQRNHVLERPEEARV
jgi:crotonobetainyl-CoA:carnitine CoA-transferase CaiB-like acyl-CoA transferase